MKACAMKRPLTAGEITLCQKLFKNALDYDKIRVHNHSYLPFNLQYRNTAMAPNGHIYFVGKHYYADYSLLDSVMQRWFIHEMVHVWQHQLGYPVSLRGAIRLGLTYQYTLCERASLADYNLEAQAELLSDYCVLKHGLTGNPLSSVNGYSALDLPLYEKVLALFLYNAKDIRNLPRSFFMRRI
jgi:hypothetical protein